MTNYKRLLDDVRGLKALERIRKTQDISPREYTDIERAEHILLKDIMVEGSNLGRSISDVLYTCNISDFENKLNFYDGLLGIAERGVFRTMINERDKKCELCFMNISSYTDIYKVENVYQKEYYNFYFYSKGETHIISVPYYEFDDKTIEEIEEKLFSTYFDFVICDAIAERINKL